MGVDYLFASHFVLSCFPRELGLANQPIATALAEAAACVWPCPLAALPLQLVGPVDRRLECTVALTGITISFAAERRGDAGSSNL